MVVLVVNNVSPFTDNILNCLERLSVKYTCKRYDEVGELSDNIGNRFDHVILSGRRKNLREINAVNSRLIQNCFANGTPLLGICYGAEIIALTFGGTIRKLNELVRGEFEVKTLKDSPLVAKDAINAYESHSYCISVLPDGFETLGSSKLCRNEIIAHKNKKIYGTQFHPEKSGNDGIDLINSFLKL